MRDVTRISEEAPSRLEQARDVLRGHLKTLVHLAVIALNMLETVGRASVDQARPLAGVAVLEKAVRNYARAAWALRLIQALRDKLRIDLQRVERGELPEILAQEDVITAYPDKPERERRDSYRETERLDRESFGPYLSTRGGDDEFADILKRPVEQIIALIRKALGLGLGVEPQRKIAATGAAPFHQGGPARHAGAALSGRPPDS